MPRFIAFHPALFLIGVKSTAPRQPRPAPAVSGKKRWCVEEISSAGGKPSVKPDPPRALTGGGQIIDSPANPTMKARHSGPTKPYPDQDTADLTNPEVPGFNRLSNHYLHSHPQI
jgi:hypothetical protein